MKSMTGYAMLEKESAETQAIIEIKGYNSRYLDISLTLPSPLYVFEQEIRHLAGEFCRRGKIDLTVHLRKKNNFPLRINYTALDTYIKLYGEAAAHTAEFPFINKEINIQDLIHCEGVLEEGQPVSEDLDWPWLRTLIVQTFEQFNIERGREGAHTEAMILTYIA